MCRFMLFIKNNELTFRDTEQLEEHRVIKNWKFTTHQIVLVFFFPIIRLTVKPQSDDGKKLTQRETVGPPFLVLRG